MDIYIGRQSYLYDNHQHDIHALPWPAIAMSDSSVGRDSKQNKNNDYIPRNILTKYFILSPNIMMSQPKDELNERRPI